LGESDIDPAHDKDWHRFIDIKLAPDPRLSDEQQEVIAVDYGMENGELTVRVRARLVNYLMQLLNINAGAPLDDPKAQQVVIANSREVSPWLL
jgi:hypothetical protein